MEIKGTKEGILVTINEPDWLKTKSSLIELIQEKREFFLGAQLLVGVGNIILTGKDIGELSRALETHGVVLSGVLSESLVTQEAARAIGLKTSTSKPRMVNKIKPIDTFLAGQPAIMIRRTMRSGFKAAYQGHVVVLGDVNPGAEIIATGCIIVWGHLRGTAHAGAEGDEEAVVCALDLSPMQLRIASSVATSPSDQEEPKPEIARIKDGQIIAELWK